MSLKALIEERGKAWTEIERLRGLNTNKDHRWSAEDQAAWDKANTDFDALSQKIDREKRAEGLGKYLDATGSDREIGREDRDGRKGAARFAGAADLEEDEEIDPDALERDEDEDEEEFRGRKNRISARNQEDFAYAFQAWARYGKYDLTKRHREACLRTGLNPKRNYIDLSFRTGDYEKLRREYRAMATTANVGAEFIPEGFVNALEISMLAFGGMRVKSEILRTATGNELPWPTTNDTGNVGELLAENTGAAEQDVATAAVTFLAYKYSSKLVKVSAELLQDSAFDLASVLGRLLGERIGRITNNHFTTGTGSGQPNGIVTASSAGATLATGQTTSFNATDGVDKLIALIHSVDPAYREGPGVGIMMHDTTLSALRKIKDSQNRLLFNSELQNGVPDRILGYPLVINQSMAVPAANAKTIVFGDLSKYKIRDVAGFRLRRLVERYAEADQEAFVAFSRHDGDLLDSGTDPVKHLAMSAT